MRSGVGWVSETLRISQVDRTRLDDERSELLWPDDGHAFIGGRDRIRLDLGHHRQTHPARHRLDWAERETRRMTDKLTARSSASRRRIKRREFELADGGRLVLDVDGAIRRLDDHGDTIRIWTSDDPDWPNEAIRFGLHSQVPTVAPHGRVPGAKPPRW